MITKINICENIQAFDKQNTSSTNSSPVLVLQSINMIIDENDNDTYKCSYSYLIYNSSGRTDQPINFNFTGLTTSYTYKINSDDDQLIQYTYGYLNRFLEINFECFQSVILIKISSNQLAYSTNLFKTYTIINTSYEIESVKGNNKNSMGYFLSNSIWYYSINKGSSWSTKSGICTNSRYIVFSDGGKYMIIGGSGDLGTSNIPIYSTDSGSTWTRIPNSLLHSGGGGSYYGGHSCAISRDGQISLIGCRSEGTAINTNYLNSSNFIKSNYQNTNSYFRIKISQDNLKWVSANNSWDYKLYGSFNYNGSFECQYGGSSSYRFYGVLATNNGLWGRSTSANSGLYYCKSGDTSWTRKTTTTPPIMSIPDNDEYILEVDYTDKSIKVNNVSVNKTVCYLYRGAFVTRNGNILILSSGTTNKLEISSDNGKTWIDRNVSFTITDSSQFMDSQTNNMY